MRTGCQSWARRRTGLSHQSSTSLHLAAFCVQLLHDIERLRCTLDEEREAAGKAEGLPARARHAADLAVAALRPLREEEAEVAAQLRVQEVAEAAMHQVRRWQAPQLPAPWLCSGESWADWQ